MVAADQIIALSDAIVAVDAPEAVVLFGSYAYRTPNDDSDVDLLVIREYEGASHRRAAAIRSNRFVAAAVAFPLDLIVRSRGEIVRRIAQRDWFLEEITQRGIALRCR